MSMPQIMGTHMLINVCIPCAQRPCCRSQTSSMQRKQRTIQLSPAFCGCTLALCHVPSAPPQAAKAARQQDTSVLTSILLHPWLHAMRLQHHLRQLSCAWESHYHTAQQPRKVRQVLAGVAQAKDAGRLGGGGEGAALDHCTAVILCASASGCDLSTRGRGFNRTCGLPSCSVLWCPADILIRRWKQSTRPLL